MSMFDWYKPKEAYNCPKCGTELTEWQGKDGPCALLVWKQGICNPISQKVKDEEIQWSDEEMHKFTLPDSFLIYSYDCPNHQPVEAQCTCLNGIWVDTVLDDY